MILVYLPIPHAIEQQLPQAEPEPEQLEELEQPPQAELELYQDTIIDDSQLIIDNSEVIIDNHKINLPKSLASKICLYDIVVLTL